MEARPERTDDEGRVLARAVEARPGYFTTDVVILTDGGGFATVVLSDEAAAALGGELPNPGDEISYAVRPFTKWTRYGSRTVAGVGLSVAGDVTAERRSHEGRRLAPAPSAAS